MPAFAKSDIRRSRNHPPSCAGPRHDKIGPDQLDAIVATAVVVVPPADESLPHRAWRRLRYRITCWYQNPSECMERRYWSVDLRHSTPVLRGNGVASCGGGGGGHRGCTSQLPKTMSSKPLGSLCTNVLLPFRVCDAYMDLAAVENRPAGGSRCWSVDATRGEADHELGHEPSQDDNTGTCPACTKARSAWTTLLTSTTRDRCDYCSKMSSLDKLAIRGM